MYPMQILRAWPSNDAEQHAGGASEAERAAPAVEEVLDIDPDISIPDLEVATDVLSPGDSSALWPCVACCALILGCLLVVRCCCCCISLWPA